MSPNPVLAWTLIALGAGVTSPTLAASAPPRSPYTYVHHPVSTEIPGAQSAFDRGLTLVFAYEIWEAQRSFREAAGLDPSLAMAWWGIALTLGPNINFDPEPNNTEAAADSIARAKLLAKSRSTPEEREYIDALSVRYTSDPKPDFDKLAVAYRGAMRSLVGKRPNDPDAAALYAESIMDLHPWRLWTTDGKPAADTPELVAGLENALSRNPSHIGLLHYYIHAVEASDDPGRALTIAHRLAALPVEPAAAHLVHMPAHIYFRVGDWASAVDANQHSVHQSLEFRLSANPKQERACGHCVDFLTYAYMMVGDETRARGSAQDFEAMNKDPTNSLSVLMRFHEWDDLLAFPEPSADLKPGSGRNVHAVRGYWHFGRGLAFVAKNRTSSAEAELNALLAEAALAPPAPVFGEALDLQHSSDKLAQAGDADSLKMGAAILKARLAEAHNQTAQAAELLREAVRIQDTTPYSEPPTWFYPIRESLGAQLLKEHAAGEAEATFREGLRRSPHDPRLLLGLSEALSAEGREADAAAARKEFQEVWRGSAPEPTQLAEL